MGSERPTSLSPVVGTTLALHPSPDIKFSGRYVTVVGMTLEHVALLYPHISGDENAHTWDYMSDGPFNKLGDFLNMMEAGMDSLDLVFYAVISADQPTTKNGADNVIGCASYNYSDPKNRTIEVGILMSPKLQRTPATTEAMYLMAKHAFDDLGYRRYEWRCDALNALSYKAALRLGFTFEGIARQHLIVKGRNRDTASFSMLDGEWPRIKAAFEGWLDPSNFDKDGSQQRKLEDFRSK